MAKRGATTVMNHDNWDDPYEPEIAGKFKIAAQDDLQKRVIKTAKRRITTQENSEPVCRLVHHSNLHIKVVFINVVLHTVYNITRWYS